MTPDDEIDEAPAPVKRDPTPDRSEVPIDDPLVERREDDEPREPVQVQLLREGASNQ